MKRSIVRRRHGLLATGLVTAVLLASAGIGASSGGAASAVSTPVAGFGAAAGPAEGEFTAIVPQRLMDTRSDPAYHVGVQHRFGPGEVQTLMVAGGGSPAPVDASAVAVNVTAVDPTAASHVDVWPTGAAQPNVSNVNFSPGETVPNLAKVLVGSGGQVSLFNRNGAVDVIVDVVGYFRADAPAARFHPLVPSRLADTRSDPAYHIGSQYRLGDRSDPRTLQVTGSGGVPSGATAMVANVTAVSPDASSHLDLWPDGTSRPNVSNLNYVPGQTVPNLVIVGLSASGRLDLVNQNGSVDVIVDVVGYFSVDPPAAGFVATIPTRRIDTRADPAYHIGSQTRFGDRSDPRTVVVTGGQVPADAQAIVANVTVVAPDATSHLDVWPAGAPKPNASNLNDVPGQTVANLVTVAIGSNGAIDLQNQNGSVDVIIDIVGYYAAPTASAPRFTLALGDSLAVGVGAAPGQGYVDDLFGYEQARLPGLQSIDLACSGATTDSMRNGGGCSYPHGTQVAEAVAFLQAHQGQVSYISIDIGGNDLAGCFTDPINLACVQAAEVAGHANLTNILGQLKAAEGPAPVAIVGMTYYDPYLAYWLLGKQTTATQSQQAAAAANADMAGVYSAAGGQVADVEANFDTANFALTGIYNGGVVPQNVANVCAWTHICDASGSDFHADTAGHQRIATTFEPLIDGAVPS